LCAPGMGRIAVTGAGNRLAKGRRELPLPSPSTILIESRSGSAVRP